MISLYQFVRESNKIEGINRRPSTAEIKAIRHFLFQPAITISTLVDLVNAFQPGAVLRFLHGFDVRVGSYTPPPGGPEIQKALNHLLDQINSREVTAYEGHVAYENLHPFTDGSGRSGRVLWLWQMGGIERVPLGFLHTYYYQSLSAQRKV